MRSLVGEGSQLVKRLAELPGVPACQQARAGGCALGIGGEHGVEADTVTSDAVEVRRMDEPMVIRGQRILLALPGDVRLAKLNETLNLPGCREEPIVLITRYPLVLSMT